MKRSEYYKLCGDERSLLKEGKEARKPMKKEKKRGGSRCPKKGKKRGEGTKARRKSLPEESKAQEEGQKARRRKKSEEEVAARRRNKTRDSSGRSRARKSFDATVLDAAATSEERCHAQRRFHEAAAERGVLTGRTNEEVFMEEKRKAAARLGLLEASYRFDESKEVDPLRVAIKEGLAAGLGSEDLECPMIVLERMEASVSALTEAARRTPTWRRAARAEGEGPLAGSSLRAKAADLRHTNPFEVLGVAKDASTSEIQAAYKKLSLKCDPDKTQHPCVDATAEFKLLKKAYDAIMGGRAVHTGQTAAWGKRSSATTPPPKAKAKVGRPTPATSSSGAARSGTPSPGQPSSGWRHEEPRRGPDGRGSAPQMNPMPASKDAKRARLHAAEAHLPASLPQMQPAPAVQQQTRADAGADTISVVDSMDGGKPLASPARSSGENLRGDPARLERTRGASGENQGSAGTANGSY